MKSLKALLFYQGSIFLLKWGGFFLQTARFIHPTPLLFSQKTSILSPFLPSFYPCFLIFSPLFYFPSLIFSLKIALYFFFASSFLTPFGVSASIFFSILSEARTKKHHTQKIFQKTFFIFSFIQMSHFNIDDFSDR